MEELDIVLGEISLSLAECLLNEKACAKDDLTDSSVALTMEIALNAIFRLLGLTAPLSSKKIYVSNALLERLDREIIKINKSTSIAPHLGAAFEVLRGRRIEVGSDGRAYFVNTQERRDKGIYYTPPALAESLVRTMLLRVLRRVRAPEDLNHITILDPAVGCGAFLLSVVRVGADILSRRVGFRTFTKAKIKAVIADRCIYGVDTDPVALATTRALVTAEVGEIDWTGAELDQHLHVGDSVSSPLAEWYQWFPRVFPDGFSAVITNPPWSKLRPLRHEFFEHIDKRVRVHQGMELGRYIESHLSGLLGGAWDDYVERTISLAGRLKSSTEYRLNRSGSGDADLYKYFAERSLGLIRAGGVAALLLPSGILRAQGAAVIRSMFLNKGRIIELTEYLNKRKLFKIHPMYRFCTVVFESGNCGGVAAAAFGRVSTNNVTPRVELSSEFLRTVGGGDLLIPEVRTETERDLLAKIYRRFPVAAHPDSTWKFSFQRELDMTNDAHAFVPLSKALENGYRVTLDGTWESPRNSTVLLPLYEGRMVHQYDAIAKIYQGGNGRSAQWSIPSSEKRVLTPHYFVARDYAIQRGWRASLRVGYCEISGHANARTVLAALLPANSVCGNKVPVLRLEGQVGEYDHLLWLAYANSLVVDWIMRRFVSTTINHFFWQNIPLPSRGAMPAAEALLIEAAKRLSGIDLSKGANSRERERALLRAIIDATILYLYEINEDELRTILMDFPRINLEPEDVLGGRRRLSVFDLVTRAIGLIRIGQFNLDTLEILIDDEQEHVAGLYIPSEKHFAIAAQSDSVGAEEVT